MDRQIQENNDRCAAILWRQHKKQNQLDQDINISILPSDTEMYTYCDIPEYPYGHVIRW